MSKLIKSAYASHSSESEKTIKLRTVEQPMRLEDLAEVETESKDYSGVGVQYREREQAVHHEKEQLEKSKKVFQDEINEWKMEQDRKREEMEQEAEQRFNQAAEQGYNQGYHDGLDQGKQEYTSSIKLAKDTIAHSKVDYHNKLDESTPVMLELALKIAKKIVGDTLKSEEDAWLTLVKEAVTEIREQEEVKIYIHPSWYETTLQQKKELQSIALHTRELLIFPDDSLDDGGCIIETPYGQIDASVDSQLREMKRVLFEKLKEGEVHGH
ncbi:flagellar assembly protein FliH [Salipaludibacillus daqingensis]|uniref:flagellar assembly protein FliH n=1 Tax=Salipaludibacillus daqingensis TaxID=3041001 RepID=UPI0024770F57|nr:flagellar assembly protein FliH [Salipaludibacillus daqingensis]